MDGKRRGRTGRSRSRGGRHRTPPDCRRALRERLIAESAERLELSALLDAVSAYAGSSAAKRRLAMLEPATDAGARERLQDETEEVRLLLAEEFAFRLDGLPDISPLLREDGASRAFEPLELYQVLQVLQRSARLGDQLRTRPADSVLHAHGQCLCDEPVLRSALERSVDAHGNVLDGASADLARIRREIEVRQRELRRWMERRRESSEVRRALQDGIVTVRNGRFVFAVKAEHRHRVRGVVHAESGSGATLFIEPEGAVLQGDALAEWHQREHREVARILAELSARVRQVREFLQGLHETLVTLGVAIARARFAAAFECTRPRFSHGRGLRLGLARHPLLLWLGREVDRGLADPGIDDLHERIVPLDIELDEGHFQAVITGPNTGGKTVALKTVGLLTLMGQMGLQIPAAAGSTLPTVDAVLADIGDEQSLEQSLSTFSAHMTVIGDILSTADSRCLVLIDELGAGTDPLEGAALGEAVLEHLYRRGVSGLVTTHLGRLKEFAFRHRKCVNACMEFDPERLAPTYRLQVGLPGRSNALVIARRIGVRGGVVDRAQDLLSSEERIDDEVLKGLERARSDLERRKREAAAESRRAGEVRDHLESELAAVRDLRRGIEYEAERSEEERVQRVLTELRRAVSRLGQPSGERRAAYDELLASIDRAAQAPRLAERRQQAARALRKGDSVFVPRLRAVCTVRKISRSKELFTVDYGGIPTEIAYQDISWVLPPPGYEFTWYEDGRA